MTSASRCAARRDAGREIEGRVAPQRACLGHA
jgi:hypothetical protein